MPNKQLRTGMRRRSPLRQMAFRLDVYIYTIFVVAALNKNVLHRPGLIQHQDDVNGGRLWDNGAIGAGGIALHHQLKGAVPVVFHPFIQDKFRFPFISSRRRIRRLCRAGRHSEQQAQG